MSNMDLPEVMRKRRKELGLTLGEVADHLGFSVSYVSDVERNRRAPFDDDKLAELAVLFRMPAAELVQAATLIRGVTLDAGTTDAHKEAALALGRSWRRLNEQQLRQIIAATGRSEAEEEL